MEILGKGQLGLLQSLGTDRTIAEAAWVSYAKQDSEHSDEAVAKLINYLAKHRHGTPFEHVVFQFYIKAPLVVVREWQRHRIGSFNEVSGRYVTFEPEFYIPEHFRVKAETNKQGSVIPDDLSKFLAGEIPASETYKNVSRWNAVVSWFLEQGYKQAYESYKLLKDEGVANELARLIMPLGLYTEFWWTVNLRSLLNFVSLRSEETAMWEIQEYSRGLEQILQEKVPLAYQAFINNGRIAP